MSTAEPLLSPEIRPMIEIDLDSVWAIEQTAFATPWSRNTFRGLLNRSDSDLWVAAVSGSVVAYAVVWYVTDEAELGNLAVKEDWRRRRLGSLLLDTAIEGAQTRRALRIFLEVRLSNLGAQRLYEKRGFVPVGLRRRYYRSPVEDARVMCLELAQPA